MKLFFTLLGLFLPCFAYADESRDHLLIACKSGTDYLDLSYKIVNNPLRPTEKVVEVTGKARLQDAVFKLYSLFVGVDRGWTRHGNKFSYYFWTDGGLTESGYVDMTLGRFHKILQRPTITIETKQDNTLEAWFSAWDSAQQIERVFNFSRCTPFEPDPELDVFVNKS